MITAHVMTLGPMFTMSTALLAWFSLHQRMSVIDVAVVDASTSALDGWIKREVLSLPEERTVLFQAEQEGKPQIRVPAVG